MPDQSPPGGVCMLIRPEKLDRISLALAMSVCQEVQWNLVKGHGFLSRDVNGFQPTLVEMRREEDDDPMQSSFAKKINFHFGGGVDIAVHVMNRSIFSDDPNNEPHDWAVLYATVQYRIGTEKFCEEWATEELLFLIKARPWRDLGIQEITPEVVKFL